MRLESVPDSINLSDLSSSYVNGVIVLDSINHTFHAGKSYALVGSSGSGKSTLLNVLMGFATGYTGKVYYGDVELKNIVWINCLTAFLSSSRMYSVLDKKDICKKDSITQALSENLPYTYEGYSVNFTEPDPNDCGVQHPKYISEGNVNPLIFIQIFDDYLLEQFGTFVWRVSSPLSGLPFQNTGFFRWYLGSSLLMG